VTNNRPTRQFTPVSAPVKRPNQPTEQVAFFAADGTPLIFNAAQAADTGATVKLTGYVAPSGSNVVAADSVNQAIAKIDARLRAAATPL